MMLAKRNASILREIAFRLPGPPGEALKAIAAEIERADGYTHQLAQMLKETVMVRDELGKMLEQIANTVKGAPEPDADHGWEDLPEIVAAMKKQIDELTQVRH